MADSPVETNPKQCTLASGRVSDGSTPRFLQGPFDFEGNGLDKPLLIDDSLRYVVPAGASPSRCISAAATPATR